MDKKDINDAVEYLYTRGAKYAEAKDRKSTRLNSSHT